MSSELPPPPSSGSTPTQVAGQQAAPSTSVPYTPGLQTYTPARDHYNTMSLISLCAGVLAVFGHIVLPGIGGGTLAVVAIVTGLIGRSEVKKTGEQGGWMATAGIVLGVIHIAVIVVVVMLLILGIFVLGGWALLHH